MKVTAIIPARGNSRRLHKKNIAKIWGQPMLFWAIDACKKSKHNIDVWVSTEDSEIAGIAEELGASVRLRHKKFSLDNVPKQDAVRDAVDHIISNKYDPDVVISLQPNSPEITAQNLDDAIDLLIARDKNEIFSVDSDLMQNAAFRVMKTKYVFQRDLSTHCGVIIANLADIHTQEDLDLLEKTKRK